MKSHLGVLCVWLLALAGLGAIACGGADSSSDSGKLQVVAVENFWGSIARQIGGDKVEVTSVITSPNTDPHDYEPTAGDARAFARARYVIVNGAGYDSWADKLLGANPVAGRKVLTIADLAGRDKGENPHMWYSPAIVLQVADRIAADMGTLDPANSTFYREEGSAFKTTGLQRYNQLRSEIRQKYAGTPIGITETIFEDMAADLGLDDAFPAALEKSISEGADVSPKDKATAEALISSGQIRVLMFNKQNSTPNVKSLVDKARTAGIPVVEVTETMDPANALFQEWQSVQLTQLAEALGKATGR
jgi:zinc/manganese transport system substrate-binding protein